MKIRKRKSRLILATEDPASRQINADYNPGIVAPYESLQPALEQIQVVPDTTDWVEQHGDRAVKLAIGLGWQVAIIYLSTLTPTLTLEQNSGGKNQSLPPRNLISKTIKSRTTSLALTESDASKNWVTALTKLLDSDYENESDARHLAQELHLGLVESLGVTGKDMRPAYELGRLLSEAVLLATGTEATERPRVYRQLFNPLRLLPLAEWLANLEDLLPVGSAKAVFTSLQNWSRWIASATDDDFATADEALREQARIWRDLLLGRTLVKDLPAEENSGKEPIKTNSASSITDSLADISLSAAFNNRSTGSYNTDKSRKADAENERHLISRATRLPKNPSADWPPDDTTYSFAEKESANRTDTSDIEDQISPEDGLSVDRQPDMFRSPDDETHFEPLDDNEAPAHYQGDDPADANEETGLAAGLSISRYSLGVKDFIVADPTMPEDIGEPAVKFANDITSLAGSLDETAENSWLSKFTKSSADMVFEPKDSIITPPPDILPKESVPEPQYRIPGEALGHGSTGKRHPGFDLDVYENFDFDFAPGFAPGFDPSDTKSALSQYIVAKDGDLPVNRSDSPVKSLQADEPDLLPFDLNLLQNFNINEANHSFLPQEHNGFGQTFSQEENQNGYKINTYNGRTARQDIKPSSREKAPFSSRRRIKFLSLLFAVAVVLFTARTFVATPIQVTGNQVPPLVTAGEWVLVSKLSTSYEQGNIVYVTVNNNSVTNDYFARIIALPGQAITSSDNEIYVNGQLINTKPWYGQMVKSCGAKIFTSIPQEVVSQSHYVVMTSCHGSSNNTNIASDITANEISGKVISVIWENSHPWFHWL